MKAAPRELVARGARAALDRRAGTLHLGDRRTLALGAFAAVATAGALGFELARALRRADPPVPPKRGDGVELLATTAEAAVETVEVAAAGYRDASTRENAMFNMLGSFALSFVLARGIAYRLRHKRRVGPFRDLRIGRRHIHHYVPGILLAFSSGAAAILTRNEKLEPRLAVPFGIGMGLTLDESALLLELEDVYWTRAGVVGVQISLAAIATLASIALGVRFLRRGEEIVLGEGEG